MRHGLGRNVAAGVLAAHHHAVRRSHGPGRPVVGTRTARFVEGRRGGSDRSRRRRGHPGCDRRGIGGRAAGCHGDPGPPGHGSRRFGADQGPGQPVSRGRDGERGTNFSNRRNVAARRPDIPGRRTTYPCLYATSNPNAKANRIRLPAHPPITALSGAISPITNPALTMVAARTANVFIP